MLVRNIEKGKWIDTIKDVLFPKTCPGCDRILDRHQLICEVCKEKIQYIMEPRCKKCGKELSREEYELCYDCQHSTHLFTEGVAAFKYDKLISKSIYRFKYHNRRTYAKFYGTAMYTACIDYIKRWQADALVPVPIHREKERSRGYNQAELIANELGKLTNISVDSRCLKRIRYTKPQKDFDKTGRKKNLEKAFKICTDVVKYKKIILVDDIYTTGSTIDECARVLMQAGVKDIYFISLSIGAGV
ncbi:MAG: ComF family protein [Lachnospiraceae bacterium]|nr:ComF family protein [Lachnospiraceae bacterium]